MRIGILGGTGPAGTALAARLASVGFEVVIGSRSKYRADGGPRRAPRASGPSATSPSTPPTTTARPRPTSSSSPRRGTAPADHGEVGAPTSSRARSSSPWPTPSPRSATSSSRWCRPGARWPPACRRRCPGRQVVGRRSTTCRPRSWATSATRSRATCSSAPTTRGHRGRVRDRPQDPRLRPLDAGELSNARAIEAFAAVLLQLNVRYKTRVAPKFTGIRSRPDADERRRRSASSGGAGRGPADR